MGRTDHCYFLGCSYDHRCPYSKQLTFRNSNCTFCMTWIAVSLWANKQINLTVITRIGKYYHLFTPWETMWYYVFSINHKIKCIQRWWVSWIRSIVPNIKCVCTMEHPLDVWLLILLLLIQGNIIYSLSPGLQRSSTDEKNLS